MADYKSIMEEIEQTQSNMKRFNSIYGDFARCNCCMFYSEDTDFPVFGSCNKTDLSVASNSVCEYWVMNKDLSEFLESNKK